MGNRPPTIRPLLAFRADGRVGRLRIARRRALPPPRVVFVPGFLKILHFSDFSLIRVLTHEVVRCELSSLSCPRFNVQLNSRVPRLAHAAIFAFCD